MDEKFPTLFAVFSVKTLTSKKCFACHTYLSSSKLVKLFPELPRKQWTAYVYRPQRNITHPRVKLVFDWLAESVAEVLGAN